MVGSVWRGPKGNRPGAAFYLPLHLLAAIMNRAIVIALTHTCIGIDLGTGIGILGTGIDTGINTGISIGILGIGRQRHT